MKKILSILLISLTCISCVAQSPQYVRKDQLPKAVSDYLSSKLVQGANVTITHNVVTGTFTISSTGGGGGGGTAGVTLFNGRDGTVTFIEDDGAAYYPRLSQSYSNPVWITGLAWSKILSAPAFITAASADVLTNKSIDGAANTFTNIPLSAVSTLVSSLAGKEASFSILGVAKGGTGIASYTGGNYINALNSSTLQQRTPAQVKADLSLNNVDNTSDATKNSTARTLTNATINFSNNTGTNIPFTAIPGLQTALDLKANTSDFGLQTELTLVVASGASNWNLANGVNAKVTLTGNTVFTLQNFNSLYAPALRITQTGTRGYTVTFISSGNTIYYSGGVGGNRLSTTAGYRALYTLRKAGTEIEASLGSDYTTTP